MRRLLFRNFYWLLALLGLIILLFTPPVIAAPGIQAKPTVTPQYYTVQSGETLSQIAQSFAVPMSLLMAFNGIPNPNAIYAGQVLTIPDPNAPTPTPAPRYHFVAQGEALSQIADLYDVSMAALLAANGLADPLDLQFGQELLIPAENEPTATLPPGQLATLTVTSTRSITATRTLTASSAPSSTTSTPTPAPSPTASATVTAVEIVDPAPPPLPPPGAEPRSHIVQAGETASEIAQTFAVALSDLLRANNIYDANTIVIGQKLIIPDESTDSMAVATSEIPTTTESTEISQQAAEIVAPKRRSASRNRLYTVLAGDTPAHIALRMGVDAEALRLLNRFAGLYTPLQPDTEVLLPATEREMFVQPELPAATYYTVQAGDTLSAIAATHELTLGELMFANRLGNPDAIAIGNRLLIPAPTTSNADSLPASSEPTAEPVRVGPGRRGYFFYTVRPGDTARSLAVAFNTNENAIRDYNNFPNLDTVFLGMQIRIPYGTVELPVRLPPVPTSGTSFVVSVSRQECWVFWGKQIIRTWACSTGYGDYKTHLGNFKVQSKIEMARSTGYQLDMPYWLGIYNVGYYENGIHGLPINLWNGKKIWEGLIGQPATFGCAMLDDANAAELFQLAYIGMPVYVIK